MTRKGSHLKVFDIHKHPKDFLSPSIYPFTRLEKAILLCFFPFLSGQQSMHLCQTLALLICASWCPYPCFSFSLLSLSSFWVPINSEESCIWNFWLQAERIQATPRVLLPLPKSAALPLPAAAGLAWVLIENCLGKKKIPTHYKCLPFKSILGAFLT